MTAPASSTQIEPGMTYRLVVNSAQEAVETIRREMGPTARVLSVKNLPNTGLKGLFAKPKIEVVAELPVEEPTAPAANLAANNPAVAPQMSAEAYAAGNSIGSEGGPRRSAEPAVETAGYRENTAPQSALLPSVLRRGGFSDLMMARLEASPRWSEIKQSPLRAALSAVGDELRTAAVAPAPRPLGRRVAFMGLAGTGRTTALSKWLAHEIFQNGRSGSVAKVEFDRPNPGDGLAVFCEALGVNLTHVDGTSAWSDQSRLDFLLADLPSLRLGEDVDETLVRFLDDGDFSSRVLVLHALHDRASLQAAYSAGRAAGATHIVFTHVDELAHWGKLWDFLLEGALTPLFLGTGPSLVGDMESEAVDALLRRTIPGA